jgi:hypothetical protein
VNPLDRVERIQETPHGIYQYFIKVVPTVYTDIRGRRIVSNQVCLVICCQEVDHTFFSFKLGS